MATIYGTQNSDYIYSNTDIYFDLYQMGLISWQEASAQMNDVIYGLGGDDWIYSAWGNDTMIGGTGNDTYYGVGSGDVIVENAGEGIDTVVTAENRGLDDFGANLENLTLMGQATIGIGNAADNVIIGNSNNNILDGRQGADTMIGGTGNDTYVVDNAGDVVIENVNEGNDTVASYINYTLGNNLENLELRGAGLVGTGNSLDNIFYVNDSSCSIVEAANGGTDLVISSVSYTLDANVERLILTGANAATGTGNDLDNELFGISHGAYGAVNTGANVLAGGLGNDTYHIDATDTVVEYAGQGIDTVYANFSYALTDNVENLVSTHRSQGLVATGNALDNVLDINGQHEVWTGDGNGYGGGDIIDGGAGADTMIGHAGSDTYYVDNAGDVIIEYAGEGIADTAITTVSYTLGANVENMVLVGSGITGTGNSLDNTFTVNDAGNTIVEAVGGGIDEVDTTLASYTLDANVENLHLIGNIATTGIGNGLDNAFRSDTCTSVATLSGGQGNDFYLVKETDIVIENAGEGIDTVYLRAISSDNIGHNPSAPQDQLGNLTYTLGANVENLEMDTYLVNGFTLHGVATGNALDNVITIHGPIPTNTWTGSDTLDGGLGADTMSAGMGDDTYYVDNTGDVVVENSNEGYDTIISSTSYTLSANVEKMILSGTASIDATGNGLNNLLIGNSGANVLAGGLGNDILTGGAGADTFVFNTALGAGNIDTIADFSSGSDHIELSQAIFGGIGTGGTLGANAFASGAGVTSATTADQHVLYDTTSGSLYYDADGVGGAASVAFATLAGAPAITAADFVVA
jgi:Ca2+-binding RTX toxin-like protein